MTSTSDNSMSARTTATDTESHSSSDLESLARDRRSIRYFLPKPVPTELLHSCLRTAQLSPSNSNTQPWRLYLATGAALDRIRDALMAAAQVGGPQIAPLHDAFNHFRSAFGKKLYGPLGYNISREDTETRRKLVLRNYEFFGAPIAGVVCYDKRLGEPCDLMGVGMWLQTLMLALTEKGLGSCAQVSVAGYPEVMRKEMAIEEGHEIIIGLAIGWPDFMHPVNTVVGDRSDWRDNVKIVGEE